MTPVFFGSALASEGTDELIDCFIDYAPCPGSRDAGARTVDSGEQKFTGFVFKIQANMDPSHHDRVAFLRINSGVYRPGIKLYQVRADRPTAIHRAINFLASKRESAESAYAGDIIGLHNHGTIQIGDTFTEGEGLKFAGVPNFAPELFRRVRLDDPLRAKALHKGLDQLSEEGATQVFRPLMTNDVILGAIGILQFDVVVHRLRHEYGVDCSFESVQVATARWVVCDKKSDFEVFQRKARQNLALDAGGDLTYIAPNLANLSLAIERWPDVQFRNTKEL